MRKIILIAFLIVISISSSYAKKGANGCHLVTYRITTSQSGSNFQNLRTIEVYADTCQMAKAIVTSEIINQSMGRRKVVIVGCEASKKNNMHGGVLNLQPQIGR